MTNQDKKLGMGSSISRRDFVHGSALLTGAAAMPGCPHARSFEAPVETPYPPAQSGLRGSHDGAFETAHQMAFEKRTDFGLPRVADRDLYDLVVVGAGVSGLAAVFFFLQENPQASVLIIENHDDFGGHAKRNEFKVDGQQLIGYGGSQSFEGPGAYSETVNQLFGELGIRPSRLADAYDQDFYQRHGLEGALYFDKATYGVDRLVKGPLLNASGFIPLKTTDTTLHDSIRQMPLSDNAKLQLLQLVEGGADKLPDHSIIKEPEYLNTITYKQLLTEHLGVTEPDVIRLLQDLPSGYFGQGIDVISALEGLGFGLPGLQHTSLGLMEGFLRGLLDWLTEPYIYHFPDGNSSVARMLVRRLIPAVAPGSSMDDVVGAHFDYRQLDTDQGPVRLRLNSTAVHVDQVARERVSIDYVRHGQTERVFARNVVLACYNMAIPYLVPGLPQTQKEALASLVKFPLVYTNVALRNWRAFKNLGVGMIACSTTWHQMAMLDFPVSMGGVQFSTDPDQPVLVHMSRAATVPGAPPKPQARAGRYQLLTTSFEQVERDIRTHLQGALGAGGFDAARDIAGITVNRWPHGYAYDYRSVFDAEYAAGQAPHEVGRQRFGNIAIANSDAGASAYLDAAIDQGFRAVQDLQSIT